MYGSCTYYPLVGLFFTSVTLVKFDFKSYVTDTHELWTWRSFYESTHSGDHARCAMNLDPRRKTITALFFFLQPDFSWMGAIQLESKS